MYYKYRQAASVHEGLEACAKASTDMIQNIAFLEVLSEDEGGTCIIRTDGVLDDEIDFFDDRVDGCFSRDDSRLGPALNDPSHHDVEETFHNFPSTNTLIKDDIGDIEQLKNRGVLILLRHMVVCFSCVHEDV